MLRFFLNPIARFLSIITTLMLRLLHRRGRLPRRQHGTTTAPNLKKASFSPYSKTFWLGIAFVFLAFVGVAIPDQNPVDAANTAMISLPLSTSGSKIVDATGRPVVLRGVNWFGIETEQHSPHGLWKRDYKEMLAQMRSLGYNVIRLPYGVQSLRATNATGIDFSIGTNQELEGKSPIEVMDAVIQEAEKQGLLILLDSHRLNDERIPELWYGDGFTEADWIDTWKMLATRYKNQANVIGADLKNEPHGKASWGTNDQATDWRLAAERCGNAIQAINPNWLIVVEGVENNVPGQKLKTHWMGANLEGVARFPVRLSRPNKLVYSPHEYGQGVFNQPWFSEASFPNNLINRWEIGWNYIATKGIAPVWIGEFGGRQTDRNSKEGIWQRKLVDFLNQKNLGFAYWSWNPNSSDTGGILQDDWLTVEAPKQDLLKGLLMANSFIPITASPAFVATPSTTSTSVVVSPTSKPNQSVVVNSTQQSKPVVVNPTQQSKPVVIKPPANQQPLITPPITGQAQLRVISNLQSNWQSGFCMTMQVSNVGNTKVDDWQVSFQMNQAAINNTWNGKFQPQGSQYVVTPMDWGRVIDPGQSREIGFCANKLGADYQPRAVIVSMR